MVKRCHVFRFHKIFSFFGPEKKKERRETEQMKHWNVSQSKCPRREVVSGKKPPSKVVSTSPSMMIC